MRMLLLRAEILIIFGAFVVVVIGCGIATPAFADFVVINEIFNDPGGAGDDDRDEYIELRGTPGMSLANMYLIFVENERNATGGGGAGVVENIFTLGDNPNTTPIEAPYSLGTNGFLTMRQKNTMYPAPPAGTTDLVNNGIGNGWGTDSSSSVRHSGEAGKTKIENSGFTAMLIRNNGDPFLNQPFLGLDLDQGNNGLDAIGSDQFGWRSAWEIVDSIGIHGEVDEVNGFLYGAVNFGQEPTAFHEGVYAGLGYEIEMISRWGNSTGQTLDDWHATNLTDEVGSGSLAELDYRQSCVDVGGIVCHPVDDQNPDTPAPPTSPTESNKGVPYGTKLTTSLGAPNFLLGDYNQDGYVDAVDYTVWRNSLGATASEQNHHPADHSHNFVVDVDDYAIWKAHYGEPVSSAGSGGLGHSNAMSTPEPSSAVLLLLAAAALGALSARR